MVERKFKYSWKCGDKRRDERGACAQPIERISLHLRAFHIEYFPLSDDHLQVQIIDPRAGGTLFELLDGTRATHVPAQIDVRNG